jgi:signal peptidase I
MTAALTSRLDAAPGSAGDAARGSAGDAVPGSRRELARERAAVAAAAEKSIWAYLGTALSAAVLVLVLAVAAVTIVIPALAGGRALTVLTHSMEPGLPPGTLLVIRPTAADDVRVGEVLTYQIESGRPDVVSHRVISRTVAPDGSVLYTTQGDNNPSPDPDPVQEVQVVGPVWYSIPLIGWVNNMINGDLRAALVPFAVAALFLYAAWQFVAALIARRRRATP